MVLKNFASRGLVNYEIIFIMFVQSPISTNNVNLPAHVVLPDCTSSLSWETM